MVRAGTWTLGAGPGENLLRAEAVGVSEVLFEATGWPAGGFQVELELMTPVGPSELAAFEAAAGRWEEIVVGDLPDFSGTLPVGGCQPVEESEGIDDLKIYVTLRAIDGSGGVLGRAGPCYYRASGGIFPLTGIMELDEADVADLEASGVLEDVIVHEMGHVLGFGTLWNVSANHLLVGAGGFDPFFDGLAAITAFNALGGEVRTGSKVPVENTGGIGTRDAHWRESVHNAELMTGWIEGGGAPNPLSAITIGSLADMGFVVDMTAADPYLLFNPLGMPGQNPTGRRIEVRELPPPTPIPLGGGEGGSSP
jgi:hypothetical protein